MFRYSEIQQNGGLIMRKLLYLIAIISLLFNCGTASAKEKNYNLIGDFPLKKQKTYQRYT